MSTVGDTPETAVQEIGSGKIIVQKPVFTYTPVEDPRKQGGGRPNVFTDVRRMALMESAYKIGATHEEASLHSGIPITTINHHVKAKTKLKVMLDGEETGETIEFPDLIALWKGNLTLAAKNAIYASVAAKNTQDSWRVLERHQRGEWGLKAGQGSVDGNAPVHDLGAEALARLEKYKPDQNATVHLPLSETLQMDNATVPVQQNGTETVSNETVPLPDIATAP